MQQVEAGSSVPAAEAATGRTRWFPRVITLALVILVVDQLTKLWATSALSDGGSVPVLGDLLSLRLLYNPGAAFSIGTGVTWVFTIIAAVAVAAITRAAWKVRTGAWALALGLVLGGATTHLLDRLFREPGFARGHVVDFIDYAGFFVGNVADLSLVVGGGLIVALYLRGVGLDGRRGDG
ncbi:signal peptidase II [Plantactinospora sp. S1510]|uniref:Lipoprotein signal peptidase n=1 Tax=Plantactinospora alkalitolerans TaxID=2789879 RepID=A0ABS0H596_9ACTN|nr:signal peptidase II [Plantactinospora alkalitolerans]MBF9133627.1 signal peptidase II [Plantactinospora alkalitolerans]